MFLNAFFDKLVIDLVAQKRKDNQQGRIRCPRAFFEEMKSVFKRKMPQIENEYVKNSKNVR